MNKRNALCRRLLSVLTLVVAMWLPAHVWADITPVKPSAGDGSSRNPYQIGNAAELYWFAALVNGKLTDGTAQNSKACAMLTKNRICRICSIVFGIVAYAFNYLFLVFAWLVSGGHTFKGSQAVGIGADFRGVIAQTADRCIAF